jgi:hypothetical protein
MKQQSAASEMLRIISNSPVQSVLDSVPENAARLCDWANAEIFRLENNRLRLVASHGEIPVNIDARKGLPVNRQRVIGRAAAIVGRFRGASTSPMLRPTSRGFATVNPIFTWVRPAQRVPERIRIDEVPDGVDWLPA